MAQTRKRKKTWISWVILLVLLIGAGATIYLVWGLCFKEKKEENKGQEVIQVDDSQSKEGSSENRGETVEKETIEQYDGEDPNKANALSGVVTYAGVNNGVLMVRVNIDQYLENGECGLTILKGGSTIYESTANIVGGPSTASCDGFDVPVDTIGEGAVDIEIHLDSNGKMGTIKGEADV